MANKAIGAKLIGRGNICHQRTKVVTASCYFASDDG